MFTYETVRVVARELCIEPDDLRRAVASAEAQGIEPEDGAPADVLAIYSELAYERGKTFAYDEPLGA